MRFHHYHLGVLSLAAWTLSGSPASAQLVTNFESPPYNASATGTLLTGQQGWYVPVAGSPDYNAFTYAGNSLGLPVNSTGARPIRRRRQRRDCICSRSTRSRL